MDLGRSLVLVLVSAVAGAGPALASAPLYPTKAYEAIYEKRGPNLLATTLIASDGKGHVRIEQNDGKRSGFSIYDYGSGRISMVASGIPRVAHMPLHTNKLYAASDENALKALGAKSLGEKDIDGHHCSGYEFKTSASTVQTWIDQETGCAVLETAISAKGKSEMKLKKFTPGVPVASLFIVPDLRGQKVAHPPTHRSQRPVQQSVPQ